MDKNNNAAAWGHESILNYFDQNRASTQDIYPSEWFFLKQVMGDGMSVLDIGCAKGGMAKVFAEHLKNFQYVGVDINEHMVKDAQEKFPQHNFFQVTELDYSILGNQQFDLVICLGILHLHETWRDTLAIAWKHTKKNLIMDLRETYLTSIEDKNISYFKMDFDNINNPTSNYVLPYNIINVTEAQQVIFDTCQNAKKVTHYGYTHPLSKLAVSPLKTAMANVYCIERS